jgi:hypothetical protein
MNISVYQAKRLFVTGIFFLSFLSSYSQNKAWTVFSSAANDAFGIGINHDSSYVYSCLSFQDSPFATSLYKLNRTLGNRDSVIIATVGDSLSFSSFYILQDDSTITLLGTMLNENEIDFSKAQTSAIIKFNKDLVFLDSLVFTEKFYATVRYSQSDNKFFVTRTIPGAGGFNLTIVNKKPLAIDTTLSFLGSPGYDYDFSVAYDSSANKIICISTVAQTYIFDANTYSLDTSFWNWDTSYTTTPAIKDMFHWQGALYSFARPNGMSLYRHSNTDYRINKRTVLTLNDTVANGAYEYLRGNYGFSSGLLVFAEAGPFTNIPPLQTNTVTNVRAYAADTTGALTWQVQINNGRNNLVHSTACDHSNTFILVRSISVDRPAEPQKMLVYKLDANGNVFDLNTSGEVLKVGIHVYPNPAKDWVIFERHASDGSNEDLELQLYNRQGQKVYRNSLAYGNLKLDLNQFAKGVYFYEVSKNGLPQKKGRLVLN